MPSLPPLDCLRFFDAAARHQSFVRAASELQVTPAAVAYRIRTLENYLRVPLFRRYHRAVRLTPRGQRYHEEIAGILEDIRSATTRLRRSRS